MFNEVKKSVPINFEGLKERWNLRNLLVDQLITLANEGAFGLYVNLPRERQTYHDVENFISKLVNTSTAEIRNLRSVKPLIEENPKIIDRLIKALEKSPMKKNALKHLLKDYPETLNHFIWFEKNNTTDGGLKGYLTRCKVMFKTININEHIKSHEENLTECAELIERLRSFINKHPLLVAKKINYERLVTKEEIEISSLCESGSINGFFAPRNSVTNASDAHIYFGFLESTSGDGRCDLLLTSLNPIEIPTNGFQIASGSVYIFCLNSLFYVNKLREKINKIELGENKLKFLIEQLKPEEKARVLSKEELQVITKITDHTHSSIISQAYYFNRKDLFLSKELYFFTDQLEKFESSNEFKEFKAILMGTANVEINNVKTSGEKIKQTRTHALHQLIIKVYSSEKGQRARDIWGKLENEWRLAMESNCPHIIQEMTGYDEAEPKICWKVPGSKLEREMSRGTFNTYISTLNHPKPN